MGKIKKEEHIFQEKIVKMLKAMWIKAQRTDPMQLMLFMQKAAEDEVCYEALLEELEQEWGKLR